MSDTIVAIATPPAAGGVGIVRVSGPAVVGIARALTGGVPRVRRAHYARFVDADGETIDRGIAIRFEAPHSFTGEDVLELHAHGSRVLLAQLVTRCVALGARAARPGEFSERAFLNGKLDLVQAEAIADLIAAGSDAQARAAMRSLEGEFSTRVNTLLDALIRMRMFVEAAIDFPEEEIDFLGESSVLADLRALRASVDETLVAARRGRRLRDGLHVVIVGRPNAGKSSLLNALAGTDRAIVTDVPGTTRDVLREVVTFDGIEITLADTAGLRETIDAIEAEGVRRARSEAARADLAIVVVDACDEDAADVPDQLAQAKRLVVFNKRDRIDAAREATIAARHPDALFVAAKSNDQVDAVRERLKQAAGLDADHGDFSARARHIDALEKVADHLARGEAVLVETKAGELLAEELRIAQHALAEITGDYSSDDLLGAIFSSFCIGK